MNNKLTTTNGKNQVSLLDVRRDAKRFPRLSTIKRDIAVQEMVKIVSNAFMYRGQTTDANNILFIASNLVDELHADYDGLGTKYITLTEIAWIVKKTVLSDEMYGISVASLYKAIAAYCKGEGHEIEERLKSRISNTIVAIPIIQAYAGQLLQKSDETK